MLQLTVCVEPERQREPRHQGAIVRAVQGSDMEVSRLSSAAVGKRRERGPSFVVDGISLTYLVKYQKQIGLHEKGKVSRYRFYNRRWMRQLQ